MSYKGESPVHIGVAHPWKGAAKERVQHSQHFLRPPVSALAP